MQSELRTIAKTRGLLRDHPSINIRSAVKVIVGITRLESKRRERGCSPAPALRKT